MRIRLAATRSFVAGVVLLALAAPGPGALAAAGSSAPGGCAMCATKCRCAPKASAASCRIERPCDRETSSDPAGPTPLGKPAIRVEIFEISPPGSPGASTWGRAPRLLEAAILPPDRPPRPSL